MIAAAVFAAALAASHGSDPVIFYGVGQSESCAAWLSSPQKDQEGFTWIMGFWSGLNAAAVPTGQRADVGRSTDGWGIVGEVRKLCQANPSSTPLIQAARLHETFKQDGR